MRRGFGGFRTILWFRFVSPFRIAMALLVLSVSRHEPCLKQVFPLFFIIISQFHMVKVPFVSCDSASELGVDRARSRVPDRWRSEGRGLKVV